MSKIILDCEKLVMIPDVEAILMNIKEDLLKDYEDKTSRRPKDAHWILYEALIRDVVKETSKKLGPTAHGPFLNVFIKAFEIFTFELVNEVVLRIRGQQFCTMEYTDNVFRRTEALLIAFPLSLSV